MPFTPTHIIAIVPIAALFQRLPLSALAIGSMVPDLPMFLPLVSDYHASHSVSGIFVYCLPAGIILFMLFQFATKPAGIALLPAYVQARVSRFSRPHGPPTLGVAFSIVAAIIIGAITHIFWDSFTHKGRWGTQQFPILNESVDLADYTLPGYKLLQYGSTVIFLPILAALTILWLHRQSPEPCPIQRFSHRMKWLALTVTLMIPIIVTVTIVMTSNGTAYTMLGKIIKTSGSAFLSALLAYSLIFRFATTETQTT